MWWSLENAVYDYVKQSTRCVTSQSYCILSVVWPVTWAEVISNAFQRFLKGRVYKSSIFCFLFAKWVNPNRRDDRYTRPVSSFYSDHALEISLISHPLPSFPISQNYATIQGELLPPSKVPHWLQRRHQIRINIILVDYKNYEVTNHITNRNRSLKISYHNGLPITNVVGFHYRPKTSLRYLFLFCEIGPSKIRYTGTFKVTFCERLNVEKRDFESHSWLQKVTRKHRRPMF